MEPIIIAVRQNSVINRLFIKGEVSSHQQLHFPQDWVYTQEPSDTADNFNFTLINPCFANGSLYVPKERDEVLIYDSLTNFQNDVRLFGGILTEIQESNQFRNTRALVAYRCLAQSYDILLDKELRQPLIANRTWSEVLAYLVQTHFRDELSQNVSLINNPTPAPPIKLVNGSLRDLLKAMRSLTGYEFTVNAKRELVVTAAETVNAAFSFDDSLTGVLAFEQFPAITIEGRHVANYVRQPFTNLVRKDNWEGEAFQGVGDPKGQGGILPLLRTPLSPNASVYLSDKFDGTTLDTANWVEIDNNITINPSYPNQGYLFPANGQLQVIGGSGSLPALVSKEVFPSEEGDYIVQEIQFTALSGVVYLAAFGDGNGWGLANLQGGLVFDNGVLKEVSTGQTIATQLTQNTPYIFWVTRTRDGWQVDVEGGIWATKTQLIRVTGIGHLSHYAVAPVVNQTGQVSINSFRFLAGDLGLSLEIDGAYKHVGQENSDTDLPDVDAFVNTDETPALVKFKAASALCVIASVASNTQFTVSTGQGSKMQRGHRLLIGNDVTAVFNGREAFVANVSGDVITLASPGLTGLTAGMQILVGTTVPAVGQEIRIRYGYQLPDEAIARDEDSIDRFGFLPLTLDEKEYITSYSDALREAERRLKASKEGLLRIVFLSNSKLISFPRPRTSVQVNLTKRPETINRKMVIQSVITSRDGNQNRYQIECEAGERLNPLDDLVNGRSLVIGNNEELRIGAFASDRSVGSETWSSKPVASLYINLQNTGARRLGEFLLVP